MITKIGIVAGEVITVLEEISRPLCVEELEFYLEESYELVLMSLGWLVRKGIIHIEHKQGSYWASLASSPTSARLKGRTRISSG